MENQQEIYNKLNNIEGELDKLKALLAMHMHNKKKKIVSLKGIISGVDVTEENFEEAKKSLFKNVDL